MRPFIVKHPHFVDEGLWGSESEVIVVSDEV
jgi:hypothetical protein